jgi:hypothetical protein
MVYAIFKPYLVGRRKDSANKIMGLSELCCMTDEELKFMTWWEKRRDREKRGLVQWYIGLPVGLLFAVPIALNYSFGWYKRANMYAQTHFNPMVLVLALMAIVTFIGIFYKRHQWDMNEQRYLEMRAKFEREQVELQRL